jgi:hypothetical protein
MLVVLSTTNVKSIVNNFQMMDSAELSLWKKEKTQKLKINLVISLVYLWLIFRTGKKLKSHLFYPNLRQISDE